MKRLLERGEDDESVRNPPKKRKINVLSPVLPYFEKLPFVFSTSTSLSTAQKILTSNFFYAVEQKNLVESLYISSGDSVKEKLIRTKIKFFKSKISEVFCDCEHNDLLYCPHVVAILLLLSSAREKIFSPQSFYEMLKNAPESTLKYIILKLFKSQTNLSFLLEIKKSFDQAQDFSKDDINDIITPPQRSSHIDAPQGHTIKFSKFISQIKNASKLYEKKALITKTNCNGRARDCPNACVCHDDGYFNTCGICQPTKIIKHSFSELYKVLIMYCDIVTSLLSINESYSAVCLVKIIGNFFFTKHNMQYVKNVVSYKGMQEQLYKEHKIFLEKFSSVLLKISCDIETNVSKDIKVDLKTRVQEWCNIGNGFIYNKRYIVINAYLKPILDSLLYFYSSGKLKYILQGDMNERKGFNKENFKVFYNRINVLLKDSNYDFNVRLKRCKHYSDTLFENNFSQKLNIFLYGSINIQNVIKNIPPKDINFDNLFNFSLLKLCKLLNTYTLCTHEKILFYLCESVKNGINICNINNTIINETKRNYNVIKSKINIDINIYNGLKDVYVLASYALKYLITELSKEQFNYILFLVDLSLLVSKMDGQYKNEIGKFIKFFKGETKVIDLCNVYCKNNFTSLAINSLWLYVNNGRNVYTCDILFKLVELLIKELTRNNNNYNANNNKYVQYLSFAIKNIDEKCKNTRYNIDLYNFVINNVRNNGSNNNKLSELLQNTMIQLSIIMINGMIYQCSKYDTVLEKKIFENYINIINVFDEYKYYKLSYILLFHFINTFQFKHFNVLVYKEYRDIQNTYYNIVINCGMGFFINKKYYKSHSINMKNISLLLSLYKRINNNNFTDIYTFFVYSYAQLLKPNDNDSNINIDKIVIKKLLDVEKKGRCPCNICKKILQFLYTPCTINPIVNSYNSNDTRKVISLPNINVIKTRRHIRLNFAESVAMVSDDSGVFKGRDRSICGIAVGNTFSNVKNIHIIKYTNIIEKKRSLYEKVRKEKVKNVKKRVFNAMLYTPSGSTNINNNKIHVVNNIIKRIKSEKNESKVVKTKKIIKLLKFALTITNNTTYQLFILDFAIGEGKHLQSYGLYYSALKLAEKINNYDHAIQCKIELFLLHPTKSSFDDLSQYVKKHEHKSSKTYINIQNEIFKILKGYDNDIVSNSNNSSRSNSNRSNDIGRRTMFGMLFGSRVDHDGGGGSGDDEMSCNEVRMVKERINLYMSMWKSNEQFIINSIILCTKIQKKSRPEMIEFFFDQLCKYDIKENVINKFYSHFANIINNESNTSSLKLLYDTILYISKRGYKSIAWSLCEIVGNKVFMDMKQNKCSAYDVIRWLKACKNVYEYCVPKKKWDSDMKKWRSRYWNGNARVESMIVHDGELRKYEEKKIEKNIEPDIVVIEPKENDFDVKSVECMLCMDLLSDPVQNKNCGHTFQRSAILQYINDNQNNRNDFLYQRDVLCPQLGCGSKVTVTSLIDDIEMKIKVEKFLVENNVSDDDSESESDDEIMEDDVDEEEEKLMEKMKKKNENDVIVISSDEED